MSAVVFIPETIAYRGEESNPAIQDFTRCLYVLGLAPRGSRPDDALAESPTSTTYDPSPLAAARAAHGCLPEAQSQPSAARSDAVLGTVPAARRYSKRRIA